MVSSGSEVLDQKRCLAIKVEDGLRYDPKSLKTMFHSSNSTILFDVRDLSGSAPFVVLRYILNKVEKYNRELSIMLKFHLEKMIDTKELVDILRPYEKLVKNLIIKVPLCFYINQRMLVSKKFSFLKESFRYIETLQFKSNEVVQFLPEEILNP